MIHHLLLKTAASAALGGLLYKAWRAHNPAPAPKPPAPSPQPGAPPPSPAPAVITPGMAAAAAQAAAEGGTDSAGNTVASLLAGGTLTGSQPGDTNGIYTQGSTPDTIGTGATSSDTSASDSILASIASDTSAADALLAGF